MQTPVTPAEIENAIAELLARKYGATNITINVTIPPGTSDPPPYAGVVGSFQLL